MHFSGHRSVKLACRCSSSSVDIVVHPTTDRTLRRPPQQKRVLTRPTEQTPAAELTSTASPAEPSSHLVKQAPAARRAPASASGHSVGPGYGVVPDRDDLPPAVNTALPCSSKQRLPSSPAGRARRTPRINIKSKHRKVQTQQGAFVSRQQQAHKQPGDAQQLQQRMRGKQHDPGRAFMQAGMPSGLWVLPLDAKSEAPPAPPPVAPEDPAELLQVLQEMAPPGRNILDCSCSIQRATPSRKLVFSKSGSYIYSHMEQLIFRSLATSCASTDGSSQAQAGYIQGWWLYLQRYGAAHTRLWAEPRNATHKSHQKGKLRRRKAFMGQWQAHQSEATPGSG